MAVVALSWIMATVLGGLPYWFSGTLRAPRTPMSLVDAMFESQSGFSTTGATVLAEVEDPDGPPLHPLLAIEHALPGRPGNHRAVRGDPWPGLGGQGADAPEMPGPSHSSPQRGRSTRRWVLFLIYNGLNAALILALWMLRVPLFDAICHAFGAIATGGFSTYNASVGHFATDPSLNSVMIELTIVVFMIVAGTNFMLLYWLLVRKPGKLFRDVEWRTYLAILAGATLLVLVAGLVHGDFDRYGTSAVAIEGPGSAEGPYPVIRGLRYSLFQVVAIMTTTGFCVDEYEKWNALSCGVLLVLMFVGGCAGSTGGGIKVIRHLLFVRILRLELEQAFHPRVVRPLRLGGEPVEDQSLRKNILVYFGLVGVIFVASWLFVIGVEPVTTWAKHNVEHKMIDSISCVATTMNNVGPGLGVVGGGAELRQFFRPLEAAVHLADDDWPAGDLRGSGPFRPVVLAKPIAAGARLVAGRPRRSRLPLRPQRPEPILEDLVLVRER